MITPDMATTLQPNLKILVIGGGFGGVRAASQLSRKSDFDITLISNLSTFAYYPQFYHSATGGSRSESTLPLTDVLDGTRVKLVKDVIVAIDPAARTVTSIDGVTTYHYDELVMALGCVTNYFGIAGLKEFSYGIKSVESAEAFKVHLHMQLLAEHKPDLNYVVVGGGPTGVELAASLGSYLDRIMRLHDIPPRDYQIELVEAAPRVLPNSSEAVSARVQRKLESLGVKVLTNAPVKAETAAALELEGQSILTRTVVWTAGTSVNPFYFANGDHFQLAKGGRVMVSGHLEASSHVYVIGDNAATPYSGLAQTAIHDADYVSNDIIRTRSGRDRPAYRPVPPISVFPVGKNWAVAEWQGYHIYGFTGYILRRLADLIGYADIERWPQAVRVWLQDSRQERGCTICSAAALGAEKAPVQ
jgi:NADH dehydrogenase